MTSTQQHRPSYLKTRILATQSGVEVASRALGAWLFDHVPKGTLAAFLAKHVVGPHLEQCEAAIDTYLPSVEKPQERRERADLPREVRIERISTELSRQSLEVVGDFILQTFGQPMFDKILGLPELRIKQSLAIVCADRAAQIGSIFMLNKPLLGANLSLQRYMAGFFQRHLGTPPEMAEEKAERLVNDVVPGAIGVLGASLAHYHISSK